MAQRFGAYVLFVIITAALAGESFAQTYPVRPVRMVVPTAAAGGADLIARAVAPKLSERLGQQVIIDNRPGAGSIIGTDAVAKAPPDGYTFLLAFIAHSTNPVIYKKLPYDAQRDFSPITLAVVSPHIIVVHPSLPAKSITELIALARARPGQLDFASGGNGTGHHLAMELFMSMAKVKMVHIQYKGAAPAITATLAGQVPIMAATIFTAIPHVRNGRFRALGVTSTKRSAAAPEVPTIAEAGLPGYEMVQWYGFLAPANTPREIVARLNREISQILHLPEIKDLLSKDGADPVGNTPEEFAKYLRSQLELWANVAREAGIKAE